MEPKNSPFVPNIQKDIIAEREDIQRPPFPQPQVEKQQKQYNQFKAPYNPQSANKPLVDLQVYQPPRPKPKSFDERQSANPAMYMPIPTMGPWVPPQYNPYWPSFYSPQIVNPVIKTYSINAGGPFADHAKLSAIYEDILPSKQFVNTYHTIGERINIHNFVRSVFIKHHDGEDIDLDGRGKNSLLSYLKFLELNPYKTNQFKDNPYIGLPDNMLIYRSCYPIRYDEKTNCIQCAPNSLGMNIRIYNLTVGEYNIKKLEQGDFSDYDVWREVTYYEYIREYVVKKGVCPNFIVMYCYYICEQCNIDFDKLALIKGKNNKITINQMKNAVNAVQTKKFIPVNQYTLPTSCNGTKSVDLNRFSGSGLVLLTEAPTYNIYGWSSRTYKLDGNIRKMVNTGYHKSEIWISIIFQLMVALYVLQIHGIVFNDFTVEDNVYIKDISQHENITPHWKYKVTNFDFYVPNNGYLLLVDSNYKDIEKQQLTMVNKQSAKPYKIYSNIFKDNVYDTNSINTKCFEAFVKAISPNSFTKAFSNFGGTPPPEDIKILIGKIYDDVTSPSHSQDISYYIIKWMGRLLNNRVGTYLTELESKNVRKDDPQPFSKGDIVVQEVQNETYKFVIFVAQNDRVATIITKEDPKNVDTVQKDVSRDSLFNYSKHEKIMQNYKPNEANLNEDDLLETYIVQ